jgi:hypothetical protein
LLHRGIHCYNSKYAYILHCYSSLPSLPLDPFPLHFRELKRFHYFISCGYMKSINYIPSLNFLHSLSPSQMYPPTHTHSTNVTVLSLIIICKSMFKGVSSHILTVSTLYFCPSNPFHYSPLLFPYHPLFATAFNSYCYVLYIHRCYVLQYH